MKPRLVPIRFVEFCTRVLGLALTNAQRVLALVAIDGVEPARLDEADREIARELFGDVDEIPPNARRVQTWSLGRGSGKTTVAAAVMVYSAVTSDLSRVGPGMTPAAVALAPRASTARLVVNVARELVRRVPALERLVAKDDDAKESFSLVRDGRAVRIAAFAASRGGVNVRGFDVLTLVMDESELFQSDSGYVITDRDSYSACIPRLLHGAGHHALLISTPWPVPTLMGELHAKNWAAPTIALAATGSTLLMRDHDPQLAAEIAVEREQDPENTARERDCDRTASGSSSFFDAALVDAAVDAAIVLPFVPSASAMVYGAGADVGLVRDSSAMVVSGRDSRTGHITVCGMREQRPQKGKPLKLSAVVETFAADLAPFGLKRFKADGHAREPAREYATKHGLEIANAPTLQKEKFDTYVAARKALQESRLTLPSDPRFLAQLKSTIAKPTPGGGVQIVQPRRAGLAHGDVCAAWVLSLTELPSGAYDMSDLFKARAA